MQSSSKLNKGLWALAYVVGGGTGIYGTMLWHGVDPKDVLPVVQTRPQKPLTASFKNTLPAALPVQQAESYAEIGTRIGNDHSRKASCDLSDEEIKSTQEIYKDEAAHARAQGRDPMQDYSFLVQRVQRMDGCLDNLKIYGREKKEYLADLRGAAIIEVRREYRELIDKPGDTYAMTIVDRILRVASYAAISDEGEINVQDGLKAAGLPDRATLLEMTNRARMGELYPRVNNVRNYSGFEDWAARRILLGDIANLSSALEQDPKLATALGITDDELLKIREKIEAQNDREYKQSETVQETAPEPQVN